MRTDVIKLKPDENFLSELQLLLYSIYSYECFMAICIPVMNVNKKIV